MLRGQGLKPTQGDRDIFHRQGVQEIGAQQLFFGLAVELTVGAVDEAEGPVGLEPADQIGLVFHDCAQPLLALGHSPFRLPALSRRRRQQHVRYRQNADVAPDQH